MNSLYKPNPNLDTFKPNTGQEIKVKLSTLDKIANNSDIKNIDILKLNIQEHEGFCLEG